MFSSARVLLLLEINNFWIVRWWTQIELAAGDDNNGTGEFQFNTI